MIKKVIIAVMFGMLALVGTNSSQAQSPSDQNLNDMMPMVAQQMSEGLTPSDPFTKVEWNPATSSLIMFMNKDVVAESGLDASSLNTPQTKEFIINAMCESEGEAQEMKQTLQLLEQIGVHFVIRIPVGDSYSDITLSSADFK